MAINQFQYIFTNHKTLFKVANEISISIEKDKEYIYKYYNTMSINKDILNVIILVEMSYLTFLWKLMWVLSPLPINQQHLQNNKCAYYDMWQIY